MKKLNNYILEKLRIDKNIKIKSNHFKPGDIIIRLDIHTSLTTGETYLEINRNCDVIMRFQEIKDHCLTFLMHYPDKFDDETDIYINSFGYYECTITDNPRFTGNVVYLDKDTGLGLIQNMILNYNNIKKFLTKDLFTRYFDAEIPVVTNIKFDCSIDTLKNMYANIKNAK